MRSLKDAGVLLLLVVAALTIRISDTADAAAPPTVAALDPTPAVAMDAPAARPDAAPACPDDEGVDPRSAC